MATIKIYGLDGAELGSTDLPAHLFEAKVSKGLIHEVVRAEESNARQGNADTKTRSEVSGGGKKPWKQKGTGRARHGSTRSPIWRHGGVVFGPHPRSYEIRLNKKQKRQALAGALSARFSEERVIGLDAKGLSAPKTKSVASFIGGFDGVTKPLFVHTADEKNLVKSVRNIGQARHRNVQNISTRTVMLADMVVFTRAALEALGKALPEVEK